MLQILVAAIQLSPREDTAHNLSRASELLAEAAGRGARLAILPEMFGAFVPAAEWRKVAEAPGGPTEEYVAGKAREHSMYIVGGSYVEAAEDGKYYNTCPVFGPDGGLLGRYRKMHLFWTDIPGSTRYDERAYLSAGDSRLAIDVDGFRVAVGICYDLRFPECFRMPDGAAVDIYCLPSAFMHATGQAHWEPLVRARAIENLAYFAAANTVGRHYDIAGRPGEAVTTYGHSMIVSPWGEILSEVAAGEGIAIAPVTGEGVMHARWRLAALDHIRKDLWPHLA